MRVLFHIPRETLEAALKEFNDESEWSGKEIHELMETLKLILTDDRVPMPNPGWPVSYNDACDVVSALHDQLSDAHDKIAELEKKLYTGSE